MRKTNRWKIRQAPQKDTKKFSLNKSRLKIFPNIYFAGNGFTDSRFDAASLGIGMAVAEISEEGAPNSARRPEPQQKQPRSQDTRAWTASALRWQPVPVHVHSCQDNRVFYRHFMSITLFGVSVWGKDAESTFSSFVSFLGVGPCTWGAEVAAAKACTGPAHPLHRITNIRDNWQETETTGGLIQLEPTTFPQSISVTAEPCQLQVSSPQQATAYAAVISKDTGIVCSQTQNHVKLPRWHA